MADEDTQPEKGKPQEPERPDVDDITETSDNFLGVAGDDEGAAPDDGEKTDAEDQSASESAPEDTDNQATKKTAGRRRERRIKRLTRRLAEAEAREAQREIELRELTEEVEKLRTTSPKKEKPRISDFDDEEAFVQAYQNWQATQGTPKKTRKRAPPPRIPTEEIAAFLKAGTKHGERFAKAQAAANRNEFLLSEDTAEYIVDSSRGHELFIFLAENPKEADELARATPVEMTQRMMEIEVSLQSDARPPARDSGNNKKTTKSTTKAPPPGPEAERGNNRPRANLNKMTPNVDAAGSDLDAYMNKRREDMKSARFRR